MTQEIDHLPPKAAAFAKSYAQVWNAYERLGEGCAGAGPISAPVLRLVKLALAIGGSSEGAVHSHTRRALAEGLSKEEIKHVAVLAIPTLGFPHAIRALSWIEDVTNHA